MNEEVVAAVEGTAENCGPVQEFGQVAVDSFSKSAKVFAEWIRKVTGPEVIFKIIVSLIVIGIIFAVYKIITRAIKKIPKEKLSPQKAVGVLKFVQWVYYFLVVMYVLSLFGVKLSAIWGAAGVAGVALAFAAQTSVSNIISGIFIVAEKTMKPGDLITVGSETGVVDIIGLLSVQIHTLDNQLIRIPNSTIINSNMLNTSYFPRRRMCITVYISYETDMEYALNTLQKVPSHVKTALKDPAPAAWFDGFGDSGIKLVLALWFNSADFLATKNAAYIAIKKVFDEAKIEIPYNKIDVNFTDGGISAPPASKPRIAKKSAAKSAARKPKSKAKK
ncbi:mechanosensitive ion channel family protein [Treponema sp.]|uniref:mechanosensitive ion channel family protein n=1 Tax=Treponema sp. TaxID=166 RepID=UPI00298E234B|nr:mechanosensitive ion channel family protein [Treponema sp.]MCR5612973.1 mechanosensitive ion channel family protein [Treponema sp.]